MDVAATNPNEQPQQDERQYGRPTLAQGSAASARRSRWIPIVIGIVILVAIGMILYMLLYSGDGGGGSGGGGDGGGLYGFAIALSSDGVRRLKTVISKSR
jgi:flagellar basal body-associated protein FliL